MQNPPMPHILIGNIPGMAVSSTMPAELIKTPSDLEQMSLDGKYFLVNDIDLSNWIPIGTAANPFTGVLYGIGINTIYIDKFATGLPPNQAYGLFGHISDALINVRVSYSEETDVQLFSGNVGGITGYDGGSSIISKSTVVNGFTVSPWSFLSAAFTHWRVDNQDFSVPYIVTVPGPFSIQAIYNNTILIVDNFTDGTNAATTQGTLRHAITNAVNGDTIWLPNAIPGTTVISLTSPLIIDRNVNFAIEGNGITLTRSSTMLINNVSQLLRIYQSGTPTVFISRVHFKDGRATAEGVAILNFGNLTLESCIFSGNVTTNSSTGGAIYNIGTLTVRACTFFNNSTAGQGGVVFTRIGTVRLTGNIFFRNFANFGPIVFRDGGTVTSLGYNVADWPIGTGTNQSGFAGVTGDTQFINIGFPNNTTLPFTNTTTSGPDAFVPIDLGTLRTHIPSGSWGTGATATNMPTVDFYGNVRAWPGAPGAVRQP